MSDTASAPTPPDLLAALAASDPGRPRVTWYDDADGPTRGERIELSARVLANWTAKAANLLVDELDVEPGDVVALDLPAHWRTVYWALAAWWAGADVVLDHGSEGSGARVLVTDRAEAVDTAGADRIVVVTLAALARRWTGVPLGSDVVDEAAEVARQPDMFVPPSNVSGAGALATARVQAASRGWTTGARVLVTLSSPGDALAQVLGAFGVDGSVVLVRDADPKLIEARVPTERVTHQA